MTAARIHLKKVSGEEIAVPMKEIVGDLLTMREPEALQRLRDNFSLEFEADPNRFYALPAEKRTYFLAFNDGRREALLSLSPGVRLSIVNLASFGRIISKDASAAAGWNYLMALIEQVVIPEKYERMVALIMSKGGLNAFNDLRENSQRKSFFVEVTPGYPGCLGMVIMDG
jgi:hypothetical protein